MKYLFLTSFFIIMLSCQDNNFSQGDCIQKPDETTIWKITQIKDNSATIIQSGAQAAEIAQEIELNDSWIVTTCKN